MTNLYFFVSLDNVVVFPREAVFYFHTMITTIRNIAIIAHVDHGKTTLVDALLKQSHTKLGKDAADELIMDSNELERERGITIFSKNASVVWHGVKINIIDTPGHADFGGEVERVLNMADGCLLLVDAKEGPMPQTRFVLKQALAQKLRVVVVVNKIDKPDARINYVINKTFDLFIELGADDITAEFPIVYSAAKLGKAGLTPDLESMTDCGPLFQAILDHIPSPHGDPAKPLQILVTNVTSDAYKGRIGIGRVHNGVAKSGQDIAHIVHATLGQPDTAASERISIQKVRLTALMTYQGLERIDISEASAGDIVAIAGISDIMIGDTVADASDPQPLPPIAIEQPTVRMTFSINDSPFAGKEGKFVTSRQIKERLYKELETDMALRVEDNSDGSWTVSGRGELHLAILIERMRREGYELQVSRPHVIVRKSGGSEQVPHDFVFIEVPDEFAGAIIQKLGSRHGQLLEMKTENGVSFFEFLIPTRGLFGYRSEFMTDTKGLGIMNTLFAEYREDDKAWTERDQGSLVAHETGTTNAYGIINTQDRGILFVGPGMPVYKGQVVGQNARSDDLRINVCKTKQLSNMRSKGEGTAEGVKTHRTMDLEDALEYIGDDELVEVTPQSIRLRKVVLDEVAERRAARGM